MPASPFELLIVSLWQVMFLHSSTAHTDAFSLNILPALRSLIHDFDFDSALSQAVLKHRF